MRLVKIILCLFSTENSDSPATRQKNKYHKSIDKSLCFVQYKEDLFKNTKIRVVELISTKRDFFQRKKKLIIPSFEFQVGWHGFVDKKKYLICMVRVQSTVLQIKSNKDTYMNIVQTVSMYMYIELIRFMCHYIDFNNSTHSNIMLTWTKNTNHLIDWNIIKPYGNSNFWQWYVVTRQFHWINGFLNIVFAVGKILIKLTCGTIVAIFSSFNHLCIWL